MLPYSKSEARRINYAWDKLERALATDASHSATLARALEMERGRHAAGSPLCARALVAGAVLDGYRDPTRAMGSLYGLRPGIVMAMILGAEMCRVDGRLEGSRPNGLALAIEAARQANDEHTQRVIDRCK